jgi:hypothetical protein
LLVPLASPWITVAGTVAAITALTVVLTAITIVSPVTAAKAD